MQPLSLFRRRFYLYSLIAIFVGGVPILILYALGYRLDEHFGVVSTGGLYIAADVAGAEIYLNGESVRETGAFRRAFFIQDLRPGELSVRVDRVGYHTWEKRLFVEPHVVTEATAFMLPLVPILHEISSTTAESVLQNGTTTSVTRKNPEYEDLLVLFSLATSSETGETALPPRAGTTGPLVLTALLEATTTVERRGVAVREVGKGITATWLRASSDMPYFFCSRGECVRDVPIDTGGHIVNTFDFFPGRDDIVLIARDDGVFATEIDPRGGNQNTHPLYPVAGSDFRVGLRGELYIRDKNRFFEVTI